MNRAELIEGGLQCDNPTCDWKGEHIKFEDYKNHINEECPKCGENILTEDDYMNAVLFHAAVDIVNSMSEEDLSKLEDPDLSKIPGFENADLSNYNKDGKMHTTTINLHNGIKFEKIETKVEDNSKK